jgi:hypothetical protein
MHLVMDSGPPITRRAGRVSKHNRAKTIDAATTAKAIAAKSQKSAIAKAKKAEKALADANKEHAQ